MSQFKLCFLFIFCLILSPSFGQQGLDKIQSDLLSNFNSDESQEVLIQFYGELNLEKYVGMTKEQKAKKVYSALKDLAASKQERAIQYLQNENIGYKSFTVANTLFTRLSLDQVKRVAILDEVKAITSNPKVYNDLGFPSQNSYARDAEPEWGIVQIQADSVWNLGYTGQGVVVGGQDTGYDWDNNLIKTKYRGWKGSGIDSVDHSYNWHDAIFEINLIHNDSIISPDNNPCGLNRSSDPCDDHGHGSHTMGTMVGSDSDNAIGVAPMATWIGCRSMERGYGSPATYLDCFEWFLAPTDTSGMNPDPLLAPDVINNSWGCPAMEGCNETNWAVLETAVSNLKAAGVMVVASAGNDGPTCETINSPPAMFNDAFTVGASNNVDTIANFSSRGIVTVDGSLLVKPDVVAPGVRVRSIRLNDRFGTWNGTSMAGPHVAGAVALIISAQPELRGQVEVIENILRETAFRQTDLQSCFGLSGMNIPNHVYGFGRIDVLKAVEMAQQFVSNEELIKNDALKIYPNPGQATLFVEFDEKTINGTFSMFDIHGKLLIQRSVENFSIMEINTDAYPSGVYYLQVHTNKSISSAKWIKAK